MSYFTSGCSGVMLNAPSTIPLKAKVVSIIIFEPLFVTIAVPVFCCVQVSTNTQFVVVCSSVQLLHFFYVATYTNYRT